MSTNTPPNADDALREQLVAYLDGELPPDQARAIEARLGGDKRYQQELQSLDRAWTALDELPRATVGDDFSQTTIEMVATQAKQEVAQLTAAVPVMRRRRRWGAAATAVAALLVGFLLARMAANSPDRALVRDLPVIWRVDALVQTPSGEFLAKLAKAQPGLIEEYSLPEDEEAAAAWRVIEQQSLPERTRRVLELTDIEKSKLLSSDMRYRAMSSNLQESLRSTYRSLQEVSIDYPQVHQAALAYNEWVSGQAPQVQAELRSLETDEERLARIAELRDRQLAMSRRNLSAEDASNLRRVVRELGERQEVQRLPAEIKAMRQEFLTALGRNPDSRGRAELARRLKEWGAGFDRVMQSHPAMPIALLPQVAYGDGRSSKWGRMLLGPRAGELREYARKDWRAIEPLLLESLSEKARDGLRRDSEERRALRLRQWVLESAADALEPDNLEDFFASDALSDPQRNELLALPRDQMYERLRSYYFDRELGGMDPREVEELAPILRSIEGRGGPRPDSRPPRGA